MAAAVAGKAPAKHAAKVRAQPVHRAMALLPHAAMAPKAHRALKARAMAAAKAGATVDAVKNNVAIPVLTTVVMAKAVPHRVALVQKDVLPVKAEVDRVAKTIAEKTATSCHATSTP